MVGSWGLIGVRRGGLYVSGSLEKRSWRVGAHGDPRRAIPQYICRMPDIGPLELVIVLIIAIVVVGPKKLPQLGRSLGSGMREFKDSLTGKSKDDEDGDDVAAPPAQ